MTGRTQRASPFPRGTTPRSSPNDSANNLSPSVCLGGVRDCLIRVSGQSEQLKWRAFCLTNLIGVAQRGAALRRALVVSVASVLWSGAVGSVAVATALLSSGSLSMLGFGVDAVVDAAASVALIWRFGAEAHRPARAAQVERTAEAVVGLALVVLAVYLALASIRSLIEARSPVAGPLAVAVLVVSVVLLPPIALFKYRVAAQLESGALRADSVLTGVAAVLAGISLLGLSATTSLGWWWADALAALIVAAVILREGAKSFAMSRAHRRLA